MTSTKLVREQEAAEILGVAVGTLRKWRVFNQGPTFVKVGRAVRYDPRDLEAYIGQRRRDTQEAA